MGELEARASLSWEGMHGRLEGGSGRLAAELATQPELGGPGTGSNPEELFGAALANCFTSTLTSLARRRELPLTRVETRATTRLEWGEGVDHHLAGTRLEVTVTSPAPEADVRALLADAEQECPVCRAISGNVPLTVRSQVVAP